MVRRNIMDRLPERQLDPTLATRTYVARRSGAYGGIRHGGAGMTRGGAGGASGGAVPAAGSTQRVETLPDDPSEIVSGTIYHVKGGEGEDDRLVYAIIKADGTYEYREVTQREESWPATFIGAFGSNGSGNGEFEDGIRGVAVRPDTGDVYVSSGTGASSTVQKFTANGTFDSVIATAGDDDGEVDTPWGLHVRNDATNAYLYVVDSANGRVLEYINDTFTEAIGSLGTGSEQFTEPRGIGIYLQRNARSFVVADIGSARIHFVQRFTSWDFVSLDGTNYAPELVGPTAVTRTLLPRVIQTLVVDTTEHRIVIAEGASGSKSTIGQFGTSKGQFNTPDSIAIDVLGNIYVTDSGNHRVQVFNDVGVFLGQFGRFGDGDGEFNTPTGIAITDDYIYVCDSGNHRVQMFRTPVFPTADSMRVTFWTYAGAIAGTDYQWTNMPATETEWRGNVFTSGRQYVDLSGMTQARMSAYVNVAGSTNALICVQYSVNDGASWASLAASGRVSASIASTGAVAGDWTTIAAGARTEVLLRVTGVNGNGVADPQVLSAHCQFR